VEDKEIPNHSKPLMGSYSLLMLILLLLSGKG